MAPKLVFASVWFSLCFFLTPSAFPQEEVKRPAHAEGQFWLYRLKSWDWNSFYSSKRLLSGSYKILYSEGGFKYFYVDEKGNEESIGVHPNLRWLLGSNRRDFHFPLGVDKKWTYQYPWLLILNDGATDKHLTSTVEINVVGREAVTTEAGTFDAIKLVKEDWLVRRQRRMTTYYWSSQTGSVVKSFYDASVDTNGTGGKMEFELIRYGVPAQEPALIQGKDGPSQ